VSARRSHGYDIDDFEQDLPSWASSDIQDPKISGGPDVHHALPELDRTNIQTIDRGALEGTE
jgi:hypothetical protein